MASPDEDRISILPTIGPQTRGPEMSKQFNPAYLFYVNYCTAPTDKLTYNASALPLDARTYGTYNGRIVEIDAIPSLSRFRGSTLDAHPCLARWLGHGDAELRPPFINMCFDVQKDTVRTRVYDLTVRIKFVGATSWVLCFSAPPSWNRRGNDLGYGALSDTIAAEFIGNLRDIVKLCGPGAIENAPEFHDQLGELLKDQIDSGINLGQWSKESRVPSRWQTPEERAEAKERSRPALDIHIKEVKNIETKEEAVKLPLRKPKWSSSKWWQFWRRSTGWPENPFGPVVNNWKIMGLGVESE